MQRALLVGMGLALVGGVITPVVSPIEVAPASAATRAAMPFDFDGDGFSDMAIGIKGEDLRGKSNVGAVQVIYGSATGPTAHDQLWHQGRKGVKGALERGDNFGRRLTSGDFNGDGYADLAVGITGEDIGKATNTGAVQVLYGSPAGLTASGDQVWHQGSPGVPGTNEDNDRFGEQLTTGDFDGDGYADLVIRVGYERVRGTRGRIVVLRGSSSGLTTSGVQSWNQKSAGLPGSMPAYSFFGYHVVAGDVTGDGRDDLLMTTSNDSHVYLLPGSAAGLTSRGSQHFEAATLLGSAETCGTFSFGEYGATLADFNEDGRADLAGAGGCGVSPVLVLHGHPDGFHPRALPMTTQPGVDGIRELAHDNDYFGGPVAAAGDLTGDGHVDLMVGRDLIVGTGAGLGSTVVRWPTAPDLALAGCHKWNVLPLSGGNHEWLICGAVEAVTVVRSNESGTQGELSVWSQDSPGIKGTTETGDSFGSFV
jgi:hypothetical protein